MDDGFLHLVDAPSLFLKLQHDYEKFRANPADAYIAFNFFVTAEHLPDWVGDTTIKDRDPYLRISSHLATGAKHFSVTNKYKQSIESTTVSIYSSSGGGKDGLFQAMFNVNLSVKEGRDLGVDAILLTDLAAKVYLYWERYFEPKNT